jgi:hypothetical protein
VTLSAKKLGGTKINIVLNTSVRFVSPKYGSVYRVNVESLDVSGEKFGKDFEHTQLGFFEQKVGYQTQNYGFVQWKLLLEDLS